MAFGQQPGPPATARQLNELRELLQAAGYRDFRDARGPLGLNQRQGGGKFTRDEADELMEQLRNEAPGDDVPSIEPAAPVEVPPARVTRPRAPAANSTEQALRGVPSAMLAAELQRRGWVVMEP